MLWVIYYCNETWRSMSAILSELGFDNYISEMNCIINSQVDPLSAPGEIDLTADVDFGHLRRVLEGAPVALYGPHTQRYGRFWNMICMNEADACDLCLWRFLRPPWSRNSPLKQKWIQYTVYVSVAVSEVLEERGGGGGRGLWRKDRSRIWVTWRSCMSRKRESFAYS